jgi:phage terminase large subunit-like protein
LLDGFDAAFQQIKGQKNQRALPFARSASLGDVSVVEGEWNDRYFNWLTAFPDAGADVTDASSGAYKYLTDSYQTPEDEYSDPNFDWGRFR